MCGIFGIISENNIYSEVKPALERLSYRGYDSAGIAAISGDQIDINKCVGHPESLLEKDISSNVAIGHNRWATHGLPTKDNAHPHLSNDGSIALVHNGIIENFSDLKSFLDLKGFSFYSDTDTEIIPNLIQFFYDKEKDILSAVKSATAMMHGAYAIVFIHKDFPEEIFVLKLGSPICIGRSEHSVYISSDMNSLPIDTKKAIAIDDERFIRVDKKGEIDIKNLSGASVDVSLKDIEVSEDSYSLEGYSSFLEKEIFEQVSYARNAIAGRVLPQYDAIKLSGVLQDIDKIIDADEVIFTGCGSAFYAAQIGAYYMEVLARKRCRVMPAGELKYFNAVLDKKTVMIAVSQSGETADTLGCIKSAANHGALTLGIVNVPNSSIAREVSSGIHIRAGQEVSVASTKAVTNQIISMLCLAARVASKRDLSHRAYTNIVNDISSIPRMIEETLVLSGQIREISEAYFENGSLLCIGRDIFEPIAKECALKIKEISYIHAEGYSASELKHGPLALISEDMPTIAFCTSGHLEDKMLSNIMEIKSRGGPVVVVSDLNCSKALIEASDYAVLTPRSNSQYTEVFSSLVVAQLFSLHLAELNKRPVDRPRNLAKSVTVE